MGNKNKSKGKKKKKNTSSSEQTLALSYVHDWAFSASSSPSTSAAAAAADDFAAFAAAAAGIVANPAVFDLHSHSIHSDGSLLPSALVERAHKRGVKVLALTDHDTMSGVAESIRAASKFGMRIIPGVEISALYSPRNIPGTGELVHILAYYGSCGPTRYDELDRLLTNIREGRYIRAKNILQKLSKLNVPVKWENVVRIAGTGVAPGRLHIARAMVEAGHVENVRQAFNKYLSDGGPAFSMGSEPLAENVLKLIQNTGGVSALAHPWSLDNPIPVIRALANSGLNALEVYRSDGKVPGFGEIADMYKLVKIGGSDFHGQSGQKDESDLGSVSLSVANLYNFLKIARPVWLKAAKDILLSFAEEPTNKNLEKIVKFGKPEGFENCLENKCLRKVFDLCVNLWLCDDEKKGIDIEAIRFKLDQNLFSK